jgi:hypothetical protein
MSWLKVEVLECDICGTRWQGRPSRPRAFVVSRARTVGGWHTNSHGVLVVCRACIDSDRRRFSSVAEHADHLGAHDIPNALLLAELVDEARRHDAFIVKHGGAAESAATPSENRADENLSDERARESGPD